MSLGCLLRYLVTYLLLFSLKSFVSSAESKSGSKGSSGTTARTGNASPNQSSSSQSGGSSSGRAGATGAPSNVTGSSSASGQSQSQTSSTQKSQNSQQQSSSSETSQPRSGASVGQGGQTGVSTTVSQTRGTPGSTSASGTTATSSATGQAKETAAETPLDVSSYTRLKTSGETPPDKVKLYSKKSDASDCAVTKDDDDYEYDLKDLECEAITHDDKCVWKRKEGQGHPLKMIYNGDDVITINFDDIYILCTMFDNEWHLDERKTPTSGAAATAATTQPQSSASATPQPRGGTTASPVQAKVSEGEGTPAKETAPTTPPLDVSSYTRLKTSGETPPDKVKLYSKKSDASDCAVTKDDDDYEYDLKDLECEAITHDDKCVWKRKGNKPYPLKMIYNGNDVITINFDDIYILCTMFDNEWHLEERKTPSTGSAAATTQAKAAPATTPAKAPAATAQPQPKPTPQTAAPTSSSPAKAEAKSGTPSVTPAKAAPASTPVSQPGATTPATTAAQPAPTPQAKQAPVTSTATPVSTPKAPPPSGTPVTLDIEKTQSTNQFEYTKNDIFHKYEVKSGHYFSKVTEKSTVIWEIKDNIFGKLVRVKSENNEKYFAILLGDNSFKLFHQPGKSQSWKDVTSERYDVRQLKFYGDGDKELKSSDYTSTLVNYSFEFKFNSGVNCKKIKYGQDDVWKHTDDPNLSTIKMLHLGLVSNSFFVCKDESQSKKIEFKPTQAKITPVTAPVTTRPSTEPEKTIEPVSLTIISVRFVELAINKSDGTIEFDYVDIGVYRTFICKGGYGFNKIVRPKTAGSDVILWQAPSGDYATKVRVREDTNTKEKQILVFLASHKYAFFHADKGKQFENVTDKRHKFFNLKVFATENGVEKTLKPDQYTISLYHMSIGCTIKYEYTCTKITYEGRVVYKKEEYQDLGKIKGIYLDLIRNSMYVIGVNDETKVLEEMKEAKAVTVDIRNQKCCDEFDFTQDYQKNVKIYTARGNAIFTKVIKGAALGSGTVIWQSTATNIYGTKVVMDGLPDLNKTKNVTVHLSNGDVKHYHKAGIGNKWAEVSNKVSLDINKTQSNIEFDYFLKGEFTTFTAKDSYVFNKVVQPKKVGSDTVIWETNNNNELSKKACLMVTGKEKYLGLLRIDEKATLLHKPPNGDWENITSKISEISGLKMSYYDDNTKKYVLLSPEKYKVTLNNLNHGYELTAGVSCHRVRFGDKILWSHKSDKTFKDLKAVYLYLRSNQFIVVSTSDEKKEIGLRDLTADDGVKEVDESENVKTVQASDSSQLRGTGGELNLADALVPSSSSEGSTPTPKPGTSGTTPSTTGEPRDFNLADALDSTTPKTQSSTTATSGGSQTFME
ncbi:hypothetical protein TpMuguga_01g00256 [Theileria parva strain Muguga]|uniref:SfiI-subtelomeric related protein family member n=1 Tax=Theileria parva TaxID=5875 RepID=Q4N958_THEPA|nr:uncharacterized protein TpMuguga_01g00256 [Theileria parva strain Muguga]EAN33500.1 hypothetical protein TpMuguga_01g00256 [Theileria parva strain Muguga]|eukprot:XP_765783.1 hypothetical protein [Theileria parva strain Muguga]